MKITFPKTSSEDLIKKQLAFLEEANATNVNFTKGNIHAIIYTACLIFSIVSGITFLFIENLWIKAVFAFLSLALFILFAYIKTIVSQKIVPAEENFDYNNGLLIVTGEKSFHLDNPNYPLLLNQPFDRYLRFLKEIEVLKGLKNQSSMAFQFKGWSEFKDDTMYEILINNENFKTLYIPTKQTDFYKASIGDFSFIDDYITELFSNASVELDTLKEKLA